MNHIQGSFEIGNELIHGTNVGKFLICSELETVVRNFVCAILRYFVGGSTKKHLLQVQFSRILNRCVWAVPAKTGTSKFACFSGPFALVNGMFLLWFSIVANDLYPYVCVWLFALLGRSTNN